MPVYLKIDYSKKTNQALKEVLIYIGKYKGNLASKTDRSNKEYLDSAVKYVSRRCGVSKTSVRYMYSSKCKNNNNQWCFNIRKFGRTFGFIVDTVICCNCDNQEQAWQLLRRLYEEYGAVDNLCSSAVILLQKNLIDCEFDATLTKASDNRHRNVSKIKKSIEDNDRNLP